MPIDISEVRALGARLDNAGRRVGADASQLLRATALRIQADAQQLAPVDTGYLRNSISTTITGNGNAGIMTAEIGPTAEYGIYQEYGTSVMPPQPFMGPAADRNLPGFTAGLAQLATRGL